MVVCRVVIPVLSQKDSVVAEFLQTSQELTSVVKRRVSLLVHHYAFFALTLCFSVL